jgi:hypothetical protein
MRAAGAQWQRRACGAHATPYHGPLQLLVMRHLTMSLFGHSVSTGLSARQFDYDGLRREIFRQSLATCADRRL